MANTITSINSERLALFDLDNAAFIDSAVFDAAMANIMAGKPAFVVTGYSNAIASTLMASLSGQSRPGFPASKDFAELRGNALKHKSHWFDRYCWHEMLKWLTPVNAAGREALAWEKSLHRGQPEYKAAA